MAAVVTDDDTDLAARKRRLMFRACHRGTREADLMVGGFVEREIGQLTGHDVTWFEQLLEEQDVDIMAWMTRSREVPAAYDVSLMHAMQSLDFVKIPR
jgi:antitoxin CptB